MLPPFAREFTKAQINQINKAYKTGGRLVIKPTRRQVEGGFLGTLASIGIPMVYTCTVYNKDKNMAWLGYTSCNFKKSSLLFSIV